MRHAITDQTWAILEPMVERCRSPLGPAPELPDRMSFEAVLSRARVGCPWRDLPGDFGDRSAAYDRPRRPIASGRLQELFEVMAAQPACEGTPRVMIDSTIVRAHRHPAGARGRKGAPGRPSAGRAVAPRRGSSRSPRTRTG